MQHDDRQPSPIGSEKARAEAWELLKKIKAGGDPTERRQLARRAFHLAHISTLDESPARPIARLPVTAEAGESRASAAA